MEERIEDRGSRIEDRIGTATDSRPWLFASSSLLSFSPCSPCSPWLKFQLNAKNAHRVAGNAHGNPIRSKPNAGDRRAAEWSWRGRSGHFTPATGIAGTEQIKNRPSHGRGHGWLSFPRARESH